MGIAISSSKLFCELRISRSYGKSGNVSVDVVLRIPGEIATHDTHLQKVIFWPFIVDNVVVSSSVLPSFPLDLNYLDSLSLKTLVPAKIKISRILKTGFLPKLKTFGSLIYIFECLMK